MSDRKEYYREYYHRAGKVKKKQRYEDNKEEIMERQKIYVRDNIDVIREYQKNYHQQNRDKHISYMKDYNAGYKEKKDIEYELENNIPLTEYELEIQKAELLSDVIFTREFKDNKIKEIKLKYGIE